jgi:enoyl-CoA hydratase
MLSVFRDDGVAIIRLEQPERRNALTPALARELTQAIGEAEADATVGALLVTAAGPAFSAGGDLDLLRRAAVDPVEETVFDELGEIYLVFPALLRCRLPTIAAVGGAVVGAGVNLALACDLRVVADDVRLRGFAGAGLHPGGGHLTMLVRRLGPQVAAAIALFDAPLDADMALRTGFAWQVVPRADLEAVALGIARQAAADPQLTRRTVATYRAAVAGHLDPEGAVQLERAAQLWSLRRWGRRDPTGA